jgi:hypothetical protein
MKQNPFDDAREIAKGTVDGVVSGGMDFVDLCTHPNRIIDTVRGAGDAIATATNYYAHTTPEKVARDAEETLKLAATMPAYEKGKLTGELAFAALLGEGLGTVAKALSAGETVMLRSSSQEFENLMREISTPQQLPHRLRLSPSAQFAQHVDDLVFALPAHVRDLLARNGVRVVSLTDLSGLWPQIEHANAIFSYGPDNPTAIWLAENAHRVGDVLDTRKLELTLRHELAHVTDCFSGTNGWLSDSQEIRDMIDREIMKLDLVGRNDLWRNFSRGSERFQRQEIVAELVSRAAVPRGTFRDELFKRMFPVTNKFLHAPGSPFLFDR